MAGMLLLFVAMKITFELMAYRNLAQRQQAEQNEAIRMANLEKRKKLMQKSAHVKLHQVMR
jgi:hypothetical protein